MLTNGSEHVRRIRPMDLERLGEEKSDGEEEGGETPGFDEDNVFGAERGGFRSVLVGGGGISEEMATESFETVIANDEDGDGDWEAGGRRGQSRFAISVRTKAWGGIGGFELTG